MTALEEQELQTYINLIITTHKINALKATLNEEQLFVYQQSIEDSKKLLKDSLGKVLTPERVDEVLKALDL
jgi:hypothetical protein